MKDAREMTDEEYAAAVKVRAWRPDPPPVPRPVTSPGLVALARNT